MTRTANAIKAWWGEDRYRSWLFVGALAYALFMSQGIPLWDDDFTSWFRGASINDRPLGDRGVLSLLWQWVWPISSQTSSWGFNERPVQSLLYKIFFAVSGYESWSYFAFKSVVLAAAATLVYQWGLRLAPEGDKGRLAALAAAVFFLVAPGPLAAFILHQDIAPLAALCALSLTYWMWGEIECTPADWKGTGLGALSDPARKRWLLRWSGIAFCVYLSYKVKADLKLLPAITAAYLVIVRRGQLAVFAVPLALMALLAVPWGPGIFSKAPPFLPGSGGSEVSWMWQPASFARLKAFLWADGSYDFVGSLRNATISLAGLLGPFLLVGLALFLPWRAEALDKVPWARLSQPQDRARVFALAWFAAVLAAVSALPEINYTFRIRYGILPMVPASLLLAWVFGLFAGSADRLPRWAVAAGLTLAAVQAGVNLNRSIAYRRDMGQVMVAVDQVYDHVQRELPDAKLALLPDFRSYDYRPDAAPAIANRKQVPSEELTRSHEPFKTYVVSWQPSLWDSLELVRHFPGCRETSLFDRLFGCPPGTGSNLMRFIGTDPLFTEAEKARGAGDLKTARAKIDQYLAKYPKSLAGHFTAGLIALQSSDFARAQAAYAELERYFPTHLSILYNHALALEELQRFRPAIERLKRVVERDPKSYAALIHLYHSYRKDGQERRAKETLFRLKQQFPEDRDVNRLLAGG